MEMLGDHMFFQGYKGRSIEKFTTTLSPIIKVPVFAVSELSVPVMETAVTVGSIASI